jgi:hypothetical protein
LAFQNSSGVDKSYKMDINRFSPLKMEVNELEDITPIRDIPKPAKHDESYLVDTSEFHSNVILSSDHSDEQ